MERIEDEIKNLREEAQRARGEGQIVRGFRWPKKFKEKCILVQETGFPTRELSKQIGVTEKSLKKWYEIRESKSKPASKFKEIKILKDNRSEGLIVIGARRGCEIRGLSFVQIASLLKEDVL